MTSARAWLIVGATTLAFVSPLRALWASDAAPWWGSFALWGVVVGAAALASRTRGARDAD